MNTNPANKHIQLLFMQRNTYFTDEKQSKTEQYEKKINIKKKMADKDKTSLLAEASLVCEIRRKLDV